MVNEAAKTAFALLVLGLMAAAVAVGWKWGSRQGYIGR